MKKIILAFLVLAAVLSSCGARAGANNDKKQKSSKTSTSTISLTTAEFQSKVADYVNHSQEWKYLGDKPAVIDFYATWCGPCKQIAPSLEQLAGEYADQVYIYKVDIDKEPELAQVFGIRSIPTLLFIPMNNTPEIVTGALPKSDIKDRIDDILLK